MTISAERYTPEPQQADGHDYGQSGVVGYVRSEHPHEDTAWQRFLLGGPLALLPCDDGLSSIVWTLPADEAQRVRALDDTALGVLQCAARLGLSAPGDLSVAGFDDSPGAGFSTPDLTTIRQPVAEMAAAAAQRLIPPLRRLLDGDAAARVIVPHDLIARQSTARIKH